MKKLIFVFALLFATPSFSAQPFKYFTSCYLESEGKFIQDTCTVVETREKTGALKTRNIYSNKFGLTIKSWFDPVKGFMTWDSHNKFSYKWDYKSGNVGTQHPHSYVMPGFLLENVSWD